MPLAYYQLNNAGDDGHHAEVIWPLYITILASARNERESFRTLWQLKASNHNSSRGVVVDLACL